MICFLISLQRETDNLDVVRRLEPLWAKGEVGLDWIEGDLGKDPFVEERGANKKGELDD